jgi:Ca2+:H+ antiporter
MSSDSENNTGPAETQEDPAGMSTPTSPTDTRHPLATVESISRQNDGLSESFQSTDTVRRRPEPMSYGMQIT